MKVGSSQGMLAALLVLAATLAASTSGHAVTRHHHARAVPRQEQTLNGFGGRLVLHPSFNIACQTRDRATRALPCDQPVWVYGSPCEIDLGLGRWRNCDDPPGVVRGGAHRRSW